MATPAEMNLHPDLKRKKTRGNSAKHYKKHHCISLSNNDRNLSQMQKTLHRWVVMVGIENATLGRGEKPISFINVCNLRKTTENWAKMLMLFSSVHHFFHASASSLCVYVFRGVYIVCMCFIHY
jgi:hypothetical protein